VPNAGVLSASAIASDLSSSKASSDFSKTLTDVKFAADGQERAVSLRNDRIALPIEEARVLDPSLVDLLGLRRVRTLNDQFAVYEFSETTWNSQSDELSWESLVSQTVPVLAIQDSTVDAVLLNELVIAFHDPTEAERFFATEAQFSNYRPLAGSPDQFIATLSSSYGLEALKAANEIDGDPRLQWIAPNFYQEWEKYFFPNDARFGNQWHLHNTGQGGGVVDADADLPEAWDIVQGGSTSITIGVIDDGVPLNHPDLRAWINPGEIAGNSIDDDGNGWIDDVNGWNFVNNNNISSPNTTADGHGTAVAGVAAAIGNNTIGVAGASYGSPILSARIFEGGAVASDASIASALYYAAGRNASGVGSWKAADVINNSWGGGSSSAAINAALTWGTTQGRQGSGSTFFFATGNSYANVSEPALQSLNIPGIVAVGATNNQGTRSDYSNNGIALDILAPSDDSRIGYLTIDTTDRLGTDGYSPDEYTGNGDTGFGGTSSATPLATGIAALVLSRAQALNVTLSPPDVRALLRNNTDLIDTSNQAYSTTNGKNLLYGYGRVNAAKAVAGVGKAEISIVSAREELTSSISTFDYGTLFLSEPSDTTFRIRNQGTLPLQLNGLSVSGPFQILADLSATQIPLGGAATFTIRALPQTVGIQTGSVSILSNDLDEATFSFGLTANVITPSIGGSIFEDGNGNGSKDGTETNTLSNQLVYLDANNNGNYDLNLSTLNVSQTTPVAIVDNTSVSSTMQVAGSTNFVTDVNVVLSITHTYVSDLQIRLVSPSGKSLLLVDRVGQSGVNFTGTTLDDSAPLSVASGTAPFSGSYRPTQPLTGFNGESPNGTWTLVVTDNADEDIGTLLNWSLQFTLGEQSVATQANGYYRFMGLQPGTHTVRPILPAGYVGTGPGVQTVVLASPTDTAVNRHFGVGKNNRLYGQVFNDLNSNGQWESYEGQAAGRTLYWDQNNNGTHEASTVSSFPTGNIGLFIPDNSTRTSTLNVAGAGNTIFDLNVRVNISMTFDSDLDVFLVHPDGTRVELFTDVGGGGDNFTNTVLDDQSEFLIQAGSAPFTGSFRPEGSLAALNGKLVDGLWTLEVTDDNINDQATLLNWELIFTQTEPSFVTTLLGTPFIDLPTSTQTIRLASKAGWVYTQPTDGTRLVTASGTPLFDQRFGTKAPPFLATTSSLVSGVEGTLLTLSGTWSDADTPANSILITSSVGSVTKNNDGTWVWTWTPPDQIATTPVTLTIDDGTGSTSQLIFSFSATNGPPIIQRSLASVSGNVLSVLSNTGTYSDVAADTVTLSASQGTVIKNPDGTWSWSMTPSAKMTNETITITATDEDGGASSTSFTVNALVSISNRKVYYRGSDFETIGGLSAAMDNTKSLLRAGPTAQTTTLANVINWYQGINGVALDIAGLVNNTLTSDDFVFRVAPIGARDVVTPSSWQNAPPPESITVQPGTSTSPARVLIAWPNNAIENRWLQIIVKANANTGLASREVFYLGHAMAEVAGESPYRVTALDLSQVQSVISTAIVSASEARDFNKDRRVTAFDLSFVQSRISTNVLLFDIVIPEAGSTAEGESAARTNRIAIPQAMHVDDYFAIVELDDETVYGPKRVRR
jgi:subtilisin-like proprotein convertase family protein/subtilisin family serine protease